MKRRHVVAAVLVLALVTQSETYAAPRHVKVAALDKNTRELFQESMDLDAHFWDESAKFVEKSIHRR